jgi:flagellar basal-body rod protein FlgB
MIASIDPDTAFLRQALNLRAYRQELLGSNIANADTPNYKARDVDFAQALREAGGAGGDLMLMRTHRAHLNDAAGGGVAGVKPGYRVPNQSALDGNTVEMDVERAAFAENALHYQFLIDRMRSKADTMLSALRTS